MAEIKSWFENVPIDTSIKEIERQMILRALRHCRGNRMHASKLLRISLRTMHTKIIELRSMGIDVMPNIDYPKFKKGKI